MQVHRLVLLHPRTELGAPLRAVVRCIARRGAQIEGAQGGPRRSVDFRMRALRRGRIAHRACKLLSAAYIGVLFCELALGGGTRPCR